MMTPNRKNYSFLGHNLQKPRHSLFDVLNQESPIVSSRKNAFPELKLSPKNLEVNNDRKIENYELLKSQKRYMKSLSPFNNLKKSNSRNSGQWTKTEFRLSPNISKSELKWIPVES